MITYDEVLNLNYYKKTSYSGWTGGMRFLLRMEKPEEGEPIFHAFVWPGPLIFDLTEDSKKIDATFPFSESGKCQAVDWLNEQLTSRLDQWPKAKIRTD